MKCKYCGKEIDETIGFYKNCIGKAILDFSNSNNIPPVSGGYSKGLTGRALFNTTSDGFIGASDNIYINKIEYEKPNTNLNIDFKKISILKSGDFWEQKYYSLIQEVFPNYEKFWQIFVLPKREENSIRLKSSVDKNDEYLCMCHYTIFRRLISAKLKIFKAMILDIDSEDEIETCNEVYIHLSIALDLVYKFLMSLGIKYIKNCQMPSKLTKEDIIEHVVKYYEGKYQNDFEDYINNQKYVSINIHNPVNFINKAYREYDKPCFGEPFNKLFQIRDLVVKYRNPFIHNPIIGTISGKVPKKEKVKDYFNWSQIESIVDKPEIVKEDFIDIVTSLDEDFKEVIIIVNKIWGILTDNLNL